MHRIIVIILIGIVFLQSCAEQRPLTGGPKDTMPPMIDPMKYSTPNYQTNFNDDEVVLTFNEWVLLKNAYSQVLISPPMKERPLIEVRHKSVVVKFKEELRENTTYSIQFGDAVVDYTEGNPAKNLRFVFSTGDYIDSLKFNGEIVDAETGKAKADVWVMLYDNLADSVPQTERPFYVAKTNKQGQFQFENIRKDSFKVFALDDQNANYIFDQPTEAIAYHPEPIWLSDSTQKGTLRLRMFKETEPLRLSKTKLEARGYAVLDFNQELVGDLKVELLTKGTEDYRYIQEKQQVKLYWKADTGSNALEWALALENDSYKDTAVVQQVVDLEYPKIAFASKAQADRNKKGTKPSKKKEPEKLKIQADKSLKFSFQHPISAFDTSKIQFWADSILISDFEVNIDSTDARILNFQFSKTAKEKNRLILLPEAVTDYWGEQNQDSLKQGLELLTEDDLGNIQAKISNADSSKHYVLQLLNKEEEVLDEVRFSGQDSLERSYEGLEAKQYVLQLILDEDANGRWSNGDYSKAQQPEFVIRSKAINLRAGWDNEVEIDVATDLQKDKKPVLGSSDPNTPKRGGGGQQPEGPVNDKQRGGR
jgi:hypothetical protein